MSTVMQLLKPLPTATAAGCQRRGSGQRRRHPRAGTTHARHRGARPKPAVGHALRVLPALSGPPGLRQARLAGGCLASGCRTRGGPMPSDVRIVVDARSQRGFVHRAGGRHVGELPAEGTLAAIERRAHAPSRPPSGGAPRCPVTFSPAGRRTRSALSSLASSAARNTSTSSSCSGTQAGRIHRAPRACSRAWPTAR